MADNAHVYAVKINLIIETSIAVTTFIFAPFIAAAFTQSIDTAARIGGDIITFLRMIYIFYPTISLGMLSLAAFQDFEKGLYSLIAKLLHIIILIAPIAWILAVILECGLVGARWDLMIANIIGGFTKFLRIKLYVNGF